MVVSLLVTKIIIFYLILWGKAGQTAPEMTAEPVPNSPPNSDF